MNSILKTWLTISSVLIFSITSYAATQYVRIEKNPAVYDDLEGVLPLVNQQSGFQLFPDDFNLKEERTLATSHFKTYTQMSAGFPIDGALVRMWSSLTDHTILQVEAHVQNPNATALQLKQLKALKLNPTLLKSKAQALDHMAIIKNIFSSHDDAQLIRQIKTRDVWLNSDLVRIVNITAKRGTHKFVVSILKRKVLSHEYTELPKADVQALVYPIYEESEKNKIKQNRIPVMLSNLLDQRKNAVSDPYLPLRTRRYFDNMIDPIIGETPDGMAAGFWSPNWLLRQARELFDSLPDMVNDFATQGVQLIGRYATVNIHPDAVEKLPGIDFNPRHSGQMALLWRTTQVDGQERYEVVPTGAYYGKPLLSAQDALLRNADRLPDHNPTTYLNTGFDEIQVYYAIDRLMTGLQGMGFSDPDLSTRPFHALLYDPDISMRDNAYYFNDTINFTTYSPQAINYARDNSTIWHELGHGIMDRLMGDMIVLADSGGLSEGMADFIAQLIIQDVTNGQKFDGADDFRIINRIGFLLTNESHDDGEAYGGAMNDMLLMSLEKFGRPGLNKMTDLTLETMRLTRNHPGLTANDWFEHMLYADRLGHEGVRASGEFSDIIIKAIETRNFRLDRGPVANFLVVISGQGSDSIELSDRSPGSRANPIRHELASGVNNEATHQLQLSLQSSEHYQFQYPVKVEVQFNGGPLQGAVKWKNEEAGSQYLLFTNENENPVLSVTALPGCDFVNREDGSCSDFVYLSVYNNGDSKPVAKKRFYLRISSPQQPLKTTKTAKAI